MELASDHCGVAGGPLRANHARSTAVEWSEAGVAEGEAERGRACLHRS